MATTTVYRQISSHQFLTTSIAWSNRRDHSNDPAWFNSQLTLGSIYNQGQSDLRFINRDGVHEDYIYSNYIMYDSNSRMFQVSPTRLTQYYSSITTTT